MRGFIVALIITAVVIGFVFTSAGVLNRNLGNIISEVESGSFTGARADFDRIRPFLHLCAPDEILREAELAFCDLLSGGEEAEKSRLLFLLEDLRRQTGLCPISVF
ncbi:MAG: hypothetical protein IJF05_04985 [Clostridia bacterium]|nr:hypothetical protein [Clostridia bacterium]